MRTVLIGIGLSFCVFCAFSAIADSMVQSVPIESTDHVSGVPYAEYGVANSIIKVLISSPSASSSAEKPEKPTGSNPGASAQTDNKTPSTPKQNANSDGSANSLPGYTLASFVPVTAETRGAHTTATSPPAPPKNTAPESNQTDKAPGPCNDLVPYNKARRGVIRLQLDASNLKTRLDPILSAAEKANGLSSTAAAEAVGDINDYLSKETDANVTTVNDTVKEWSGKVDDLRALCPLNLVAEIKLEEEPSTKHAYQLYFDHDDFSNDSLTVLQENGMLTSVTASADDQTGAILVAGAKTLGEVAFLIGPQASVGLAAGALGKSGLAGGKSTYLSDLTGYSNTLQKDKKPLQALKDLRSIVNQLKAYIGLRDAIPSLDPLLPVEVDLHVASLPNDLVQANKVLSPLALNLQAECGSIGNETPLPPAKMQGKPADDLPADESMKPQAGIFVSAQVPCTVELDRSSDSQGFSVLKRAGFMAQDARRVYLLPFDRGTFVLNKTAYEFSNGRLTKTDITRPSEVLGAVSLPLQVISAFFSSITDGIKGKSAVINAETDRLTAQTNLLKAKAALTDAQPKPSGTSSQ